MNKTEFVSSEVFPEGRVTARHRRAAGLTEMYLMFARVEGRSAADGPESPSLKSRLSGIQKSL